MYGSGFYGSDSYFGGATPSSLNVTITLVTQDILGNYLSGRLRIEQPNLGSSGDILIPRILEVLTTGIAILSVAPGVPADYYFTPDLGNDIGYYIGSLTPSTAGDFGILLRTAAGQLTGVHSYRSAAGTFEATAAPPTKPVYFTMAVPAILKNGIVVIPINKPIAEPNGTYSMTVPQTTDMYSPSGESIKARLILDTLKVGFADMVVPAISSLKFSVTGQSAVLISA